MKILKTEELNEKMNIQPVSKKRLKDCAISSHKPSKNYVFDFKTGDIVFMSNGKDPKALVYVSYEDIMRHTYDDVFDLIPRMSQWEEVVCDGAFMQYYENDGFKFISLKSFDKNFVYNSIGLRIWLVYRYENLKLPLDAEYFKHPDAAKAKLVWSRV